jgi:hypothetical protein
MSWRAVGVWGLLEGAGEALLFGQEQREAASKGKPQQTKGGTAPHTPHERDGRRDEGARGNELACDECLCSAARDGDGCSDGSGNGSSSDAD